MKLKLFAIGIFFSGAVYGQTINVQSGITLSKLQWTLGNSDFGSYDKVKIGSSTFVGIDYLDKTYFNVSSNLGFITKGGKETINIRDESGIILSEKVEKASLNYVSLNSTFNIKYPIKEKIIPFVSLGPRVDYLLSYSNDFDCIEDIDALNKINYGLIVGCGVKYDFQKIQLGVRADRYVNINKIADWQVAPENVGGSITDNTFSINASVGLKL